MLHWAISFFIPNKLNYQFEIGVGRFDPAPYHITTDVLDSDSSLDELNKHICDYIYQNYMNVQKRLIQTHLDQHKYASDIFLKLTLNGYWNKKQINMIINSFSDYKNFIEEQNLTIPNHIHKIINQEENGILNFYSNNCYWCPTTHLDFYFSYIVEEKNIELIDSFKNNKAQDRKINFFINIPQENSFESVIISLERSMELSASLQSNLAITHFFVETKGLLQGEKIHEKFDDINQFIQFLEFNQLLHSGTKNTKVTHLENN